MKRTATGFALEYPTDLRGFTHEGVTLVRHTPLHEKGEYIATDKSGRDWFVTTVGGTNRYPWVICRPAAAGGTRAGEARDLIHVAEWISAQPDSELLEEKKT